MIYALVAWALTAAMTAHTWWCYRVGEISTKGLTVRREEQPTIFNICLALSVVLCITFAALAMKWTIAATGQDANGSAEQAAQQKRFD